MALGKLITENRLDTWVRGNIEESKGMVVELIKRLILRSVPDQRQGFFPSNDSYYSRFI